MRIGIEAERANSLQKTGVEHYAKQLILHLAALDRDNEYILYLRTKPQDWFLNLPKNFSVKVMPFPLFWTQLRISWEILFHPVDVLFIPASALPLVHPRQSVVTIHDLAWLFYPEAETWFNRNFLKISSWFAARSASRLIAVSESTKQDIMRVYHLPADKIAVVHHGFEPRPPSGMQLAGKIAERLPERYVYFLSTLQPRKNVPALVRAFAKLKTELPELPHKLVIAGRQGWKFQESMEEIEQHRDCVEYLGHIGDSDRLEVMRRADAFILPSLYEGFGMTLLEAFDAGIPVATSNISSMPEVAGEAAVYFDPTDENDIKNCLKALLCDQSLVERLREQGKVRLQQFGWERCARQTLQVLTTQK